jgi:hypothetical protein
MSDETAQTANTAQTTDSAPADVPSEAPQAPTSEVTPPLAKDDNLAQNVPESQPIETPQMAQTGENPPALEQKPEPSLTPETPPTSPETGTAQTPVNEPLPAQPEPITQNKSSLARQLLISARNAIQFRKRKKLDRVMSLFLQHSKITNDEVEKFLHVSDATATRYLSILETEGKIKQNGKTGHMVSYSRI